MLGGQPKHQVKDPGPDRLVFHKQACNSPVKKQPVPWGNARLAFTLHPRLPFPKLPQTREPPRLFLVLLPGGSPSGPGHGISSPCLFLRCKSKTLRPKPELTMLARKLWGQCEDDRQEAPMPFPHRMEEYTVWSWRKSPGWSDSEQGSMLHSTSGGCDKCVVSPQPDPPRAYSHAGDTVPTHERHLNYHTNAVCF